MAVGDGTAQKFWTLPEIIERMQNAYCSTLSAEFDHLSLQYVSCRPSKRRRQAVCCLADIRIFHIGSQKDRISRSISIGSDPLTRLQSLKM